MPTRKSNTITPQADLQLADPPPGDDDYTYDPDEDVVEDDPREGHPSTNDGKVMTMVNETPEGFEVRATYSRTVNYGNYESARCELVMVERFPGTSNPNEIAELAQSQFQVLKSEVLAQLDMQFETDDAGRVKEMFQGSRLVSSRSQDQAPTTAQRPAQGRPAARQAQTGGRGQQPRSGAQGQRSGQPQGRTGGGRPGGRPAARPQGNQVDYDALWNDLWTDPGGWEDHRDDKESDRHPDFTSLKFNNERGYPQGLWINKQAPYSSDDINDHLEVEGLYFANENS